MQKTETYKFNLIEATDSFSPDPINENVSILESALASKLGGDYPGWVTGTYTGTGAVNEPYAVDVGFKPTFLFIIGGTSGYRYGFMLRHGENHFSVSTVRSGGSNAANPMNSGQITCTETGFTVNKNDAYNTMTVNEADVYYYVAFR